ncbi:MAG: hypothetical protein WBX15_08455 [Thermoanaerobaculia bacterium]
MKKINVRVPVRADLAGGTLDLWPIYLFHPSSRTVNVAISRYVECEVQSRSEEGIEIFLADEHYHRHFGSLTELAVDPRLSLVSRLVEHFRPGGLAITVRSDVPRGSGLGGSSALAIALSRALSELSGDPVEGEELIALVRDLETRLLRCPAGVQDYYPAVFGGIAALHLDPGRVIRHPIALPLPDLAQRLLIYYSGVAHFSGTNNWEIYKRHLDGDPRVFEGLRAIAESATSLEEALAAGAFDRAAAAMNDEWTARKSLFDGVTTVEVDRAIEVAMKSGADAAKVCGAGGGGCIVFMVPPEKRERVAAALEKSGGQILDAVPVAQGLVMERSDQVELSHWSRRTLMSEGGSEDPGQFFLHTDEPGTYRPFIVAEAAVTFDDARKGVHQTVVRVLAASLDVRGERVLWSESLPVDPDRLRLDAAPDPAADIDTSVDADLVFSISRQGEDLLREYLAEQERLRLWFNPAFAIYSEAGEARSAFVDRCLEFARREAESQTERLESTFRRRIDQLREKADRQQREADETDIEVERREVGIAWGQTLFNITSGRPADVGAPQSVEEADFLERIRQVQRTWEREVRELQDELDSKARQIEEVAFAPSLKNVEVRKFLILWAPSLRDVVAAAE